MNKILFNSLYFRRNLANKLVTSLVIDLAFTHTFQYIKHDTDRGRLLQGSTLKNFPTCYSIKERFLTKLFADIKFLNEK